jgi:hypothetical protein
MGLKGRQALDKLLVIMHVVVSGVDCRAVLCRLGIYRALPVLNRLPTQHARYMSTLYLGTLCD